MPNSWHASAGAQTEARPTHATPWHVASSVHAAPAQGSPAWIGVTEHFPVPGSQCSAALQRPATGHAATTQHTPSTQWPRAQSPCVMHASPVPDPWTKTYALPGLIVEAGAPATIVLPSSATAVPSSSPVTPSLAVITCSSVRLPPEGPNT